MNDPTTPAECIRTARAFVASANDNASLALADVETLRAKLAGDDLDDCLVALGCALRVSRLLVEDLGGVEGHLCQARKQADA